jgi:hypothetical protein
MRVTVAALTVAVAGVVAAAGCAGDAAEPKPPASASATPSIVSTALVAPRLLPGQPVPTPAKAPVLTLTGRIGQTNGTGRTLTLDVATIEGMGLREVTLYEPWVKRRMSFRGVWLADLLEVAGVDRTAQVVHLSALDDYAVDLRMSEVAAGGIFLATRTGAGAPIPVPDGGPTRIVFVGDVASGRNAARWIWSLETLDIR